MVIQKIPKWRRQPAHRPPQILDAALRVFGETGVAGATLDEIAARAGVSKGTIYLYFASKEDLFRQTIGHALTQVQPTKSASLATAERQLSDSIAAYWRFLTSEPGRTASRLVLAEQWQFPDLARGFSDEVVSRFVEDLEAAIQRGIANGEFRDVDPLVAARSLAALTIQTAAWQGTGSGPGVGGKSIASPLREITDFCVQSVAQLDSAFPQADGASELRGTLNN